MRGGRSFDIVLKRSGSGRVDFHLSDGTDNEGW
jgi:hypothetical protein